MPSLAFYPTSFLTKTCQFRLLTKDAPSMALLLLQDKMLLSAPNSSKSNALQKRKKEGTIQKEVSPPYFNC